MDAFMWLALTALVPILLLCAYVRINDTKLLIIPERALALSPQRCSPSDVLADSDRLKTSPISLDGQLPPKTGRRYIVVGGVSP